MWRPKEGWKEKVNAIRKNVNLDSCLAMEEKEDHENALIEAGADAIIEALRREGDWGTMLTYDATFHIGKKRIIKKKESNKCVGGVIVFIPDEEVKSNV